MAFDSPLPLSLIGQNHAIWLVGVAVFLYGIYWVYHLMTTP